MTPDDYIYATLTPEQREEYMLLKEGSLSNSLRAWGRDLALAPKMERLGHPALAGAGVGAFHGLVSGVMDARDEGQGWGDAVQSGLKGGLKGGVVGGAIGAGAGVASPALAQRTSNFGKGFLHTVTGWKPKGGLAELGTGSALAKKQLAQMEAAGMQGPSLDAMRRHVAALENVESQNLTNLPGMLRGLLDPRRTIDTLKASKGMLVDGLDTQGKVLFGLGLASSVVPAMTADDATLSQRAGMVARPLIGMTLGAPLQAGVMQAGANASTLGSMVEGIAHNVPGNSVNRIMNAPIDYAASKLGPSVPAPPTTDMPPDAPQPSTSANIDFMRGRSFSPYNRAMR